MRLLMMVLMIFAVGSVIGCAATNEAPVSHAAMSEPAPPEAPPEAAPEAAADAGTIELTVHGMSCPLCATNIDKQILRVPGVDSVNVNLATGSVLVHFSGDEPAREDLVQAVHESGFTLVGEPQAR